MQYGIKEAKMKSIKSDTFVLFSYTVESPATGSLHMAVPVQYSMHFPLRNARDHPQMLVVFAKSLN